MTKYSRDFSYTDQCVGILDDALRTVFAPALGQRPTPGSCADRNTETTSKRHSAQLMRVNHTGEVCAQALYQAQALTARSDTVRRAMEQAALEENDHLRWCEQRLAELDSHKSYLNPVWYGGSFAVGAVFGLIGDRWNLGFLAETERQVVAHLQEHLDQLATDDHRSRAILEQMRSDEQSHATEAIKAGAEELPDPIKRAMAFTSKIMTTTAAWI